MLLQLQPITLICPTVPHQRETESFSSIQPSDLRTVLLGGDLLGRRSSNWGVIEVTKRGEVNIPGIPSCCRPDRRTRLLPYLPWVRPASLSSFCSTKKCNYFIHWIDHVIVHLKICFDDCYHICEKLVHWSPPFDLPWFWRQSHHTTNCQPTLTNCWVSRRKVIYKVN